MARRSLLVCFVVLAVAFADYDELREFEDEDNVAEAPPSTVPAENTADEDGANAEKPKTPPKPRYILPPPFEPLQPVADFATQQPMVVMMILYMIAKNFLLPAQSAAFPEHPGNKITQITSLAEYKQVISKNRFCVIDFYALWCGPCKKCAVPFGKLSEDEPASGFKFFKCDVDKCKDVASACGVESMPTFQFYDSGKKFHTMSGWKPSEINKMMDSKRGKKAN